MYTIIPGFIHLFYSFLVITGLKRNQQDSHDRLKSRLYAHKLRELLSAEANVCLGQPNGGGSLETKQESKIQIIVLACVSKLVAPFNHITRLSFILSRPNISPKTPRFFCCSRCHRLFTAAERSSERCVAVPVSGRPARFFW